MKPNLFLSLACTLTIFAVGSGYQRLTVEAPITAAPLETISAPFSAAPRGAHLPVLPTVYVVAVGSAGAGVVLTRAVLHI